MKIWEMAYLSPYHNSNHDREHYIPLYITHKDGNKVKNLLQTFCGSLQDILCKTSQEDEKVSQVFCKKL